MRGKRRNNVLAAFVAVLSFLLLSVPLGAKAKTVTGSSPFQNIRIYECADFADAELKELYGSKVERESFRNLLSDDYALPEGSTPPDLVLILTRTEDLLKTVEQTDAEGTVRTETQQLSNMDLKRAVSRLRASVPDTVPVLWTILVSADDLIPAEEEDAGSKKNYYVGPQGAYRTLLELQNEPTTRNFYANYTFYRLTDVQTFPTGSEGTSLPCGDGYTGSPDGRKALAERIALPLSGILPLSVEAEEAPPYTDVFFYISENGNDKANGLSPATAVKSGTGLVTAIQNRFGGVKYKENGTTKIRWGAIPEWTRIVVEVSGEVLWGTSQGIFGIFVESQLPRDVAGYKVPVVIETYGYNGSNRATIYGTYAPHDEGSSRFSIESPAEFRNLCIKTVPTVDGRYSMHNFWIRNNTVTFDNVTFDAGPGRLVILSASNNVWSDTYDVPEGTFLDAELVFLNGVYDETTGVGLVSGMNASTLWRNTESVTEGYQLRFRVTVGEGAVVGNLYALTNALPVDTVELVVRDGGRVKKLAFTNDRQSEASFTAKHVRIRVENGIVERGIRGIGTHTRFTGEAEIDVEDSLLLLAPENETDYSCLFGDSGAVVDGSFRFSIRNTLISVAAGLNQPSVFYLGGKGFETTENAVLSGTIENTSVVFLSNKTLTNEETFLRLLPEKSRVKGRLELSLMNVLTDTTDLTHSCIGIGDPESEGTETALTIQNFTAGEISLAFKEGAAVTVNGEDPALFPETFREAGNRIAVLNGERTEKHAESETEAGTDAENGAVIAGKPFPWLYLGIVGGVMLLVAVIAVLLIARNRKKRLRE